jgi:hypothetical protein
MALLGQDRSYSRQRRTHAGAAASSSSIERSLILNVRTHSIFSAIFLPATTDIQYPLSGPFVKRESVFENRPFCIFGVELSSSNASTRGKSVCGFFMILRTIKKMSVQHHRRNRPKPFSYEPSNVWIATKSFPKFRTHVNHWNNEVIFATRVVVSTLSW